MKSVADYIDAVGDDDDAGCKLAFQHIYAALDYLALVLWGDDDEPEEPNAEVLS